MEATRTPAAAKVLGAIAVIAVLAAGGWLIVSHGPGTDLVRIGLTIAFFFLVSFLIARVADRRPDMKQPLRIAFLFVAITASGLYVWDSYLRPKSEKTEQVDVAEVKASDVQRENPTGAGADEPEPPPQNVELSTGSFDGLAGHSAEGDVRVIQRADGGLRLVFDDFEVTQGPDLRVYLVDGSDVEGGNFEDVGSLKAEKGRFQYDIDDIDTDKYSTVFVWCRAFSTPFGSAPLKKS